MTHTDDDGRLGLFFGQERKGLEGVSSGRRKFFRDLFLLYDSNIHEGADDVLE